MGLQLTVMFTSSTPTWEKLRTRLSEKGIAAILRMIDGMPAFPDEEPDATWNELRISTDQGMMTLRQGIDEITCIVWGTANEALQKQQQTVAQTLVELTSGLLASPRSAH
jgi:hypothetical protein